MWGQFEFLLLLFWVIVQVSSGFASNYIEFGKLGREIGLTYTWFMLNFAVLLFDAMPLLKSRYKMILLSICIFNSVRIILVDRFVDTYYEEGVCITVCSNTRILSLNGLFQMLLFYIKNVVMVFYNPDLLMLVSVPVRYAMVKLD